MTQPDNPLMYPARLQRAADLIRQADALIVAAGAGKGVDSGLPDFRGQEGFWRAYPALARARIDFHRIASPSAFHASPALAWGFYGHRLALYRRTQPHHGFELLWQWGERIPNGLSVFTSNVDGHFQRTGFDPLQIHECHGSIHHLQCLQPCCAAIWPAQDFQPDVDEETCQLLNPAPRFPHCGGLARPNVLMFSDGAGLRIALQFRPVDRRFGCQRSRDRWSSSWAPAPRSPLSGTSASA